MWLLLAIFIIIKLFVFHKMQTLDTDKYVRKICPTGYNGVAPDPLDCNSYYLCPETIQLFCEADQQFDIDSHGCIPMSFEYGCAGRLYKNLLL